MAPKGIKEINRLSENINIPIIGIVGVNSKNFNEIIDAGASGIAIMSSLMKSNNPEKLVLEILGILK
nr:thiamine phosphate synthase [Clostridium uliginosum]